MVYRQYGQQLFSVIVILGAAGGVVDKIAAVETGVADRPVEDVKIIKMTVLKDEPKEAEMPAVDTKDKKKAKK